jgi:hypothetical protein
MMGGKYPGILIFASNPGRVGTVREFGGEAWVVLAVGEVGDDCS